jgi:hydrogenase maturation protein HypF
MPGHDARRVRVRIEGTVQGVGFRPHVFRLAHELALTGFVHNVASAVELEAEGTPDAVQRLLARVVAEAPPLAGIERVVSVDVAARGDTGFVIVASTAEADPMPLISPDAATCIDCLQELDNPHDRRFRYPFINCTNCGPRFTIVRGVPYDRARTTMAGFAMCAACQREYDDPANRRFHAQPNACRDCGPRLALLDRAGVAAAIPAGVDVIAHAAALLRGGAIVAIKGLGGFHLACVAAHASAVTTLRARKHRERKPFALMVADIAQARTLVHLSADDAAALQLRQRPIVLCRRRDDAPVAADVAPGVSEFGLMLPYTPLHHLLLADVGAPLVMTSGNRSDEPIVFRDAEAVPRLGAIADWFVMHNRPIETRTDDSVVRPPAMLRRSRGYVPSALSLPDGAPALLACGAELKHTFCVARGNHAWLSHHVGDLTNYETWQSFTEGVAHFEALLECVPEIFVHDLHPDYRSTRYALERVGRHVGVQHHHAHFAACLAEHGVTDAALGVIYDGTGYGPDGTVWGGELLHGDIAASTRVGHLRTVPMPGGDRAVQQPWRMACAWLADVDGPAPVLPATLRDAVDARRWRAVSDLLRSDIGMPATSSVGRLFDAVSALAGVVSVAMYEGQAAIELEALADHDVVDGYPIALRHGTDDQLILDPRAMIAQVRHDASHGASAAAMAGRFHRGLSTATAHAAIALAERLSLRTVVLSGGVFQNRLLLAQVRQQLLDAGMTVLTPERVPANDGGIAFGQAATAAARERRSRDVATRGPAASP